MLQSIYKKKEGDKKSTKTLKISFYNFKLFAYNKVVQKVMIKMGWYMDKSDLIFTLEFRRRNDLTCHTFPKSRYELLV